MNTDTVAARVVASTVDRLAWTIASYSSRMWFHISHTLEKGQYHGRSPPCRNSAQYQTCVFILFFHTVACLLFVFFFLITWHNKVNVGPDPTLWIVFLCVIHNIIHSINNLWNVLPWSGSLQLMTDPVPQLTQAFSHVLIHSDRQPSRMQHQRWPDDLQHQSPVEYVKWTYLPFVPWNYFTGYIVVWKDTLIVVGDCM